MSKKGVDYPELRAQLETLSNKELHHKCVEYGMNVPVADSTRDVIIRKLIKSITGDTNVASPKANKTKQQQRPSTPNERRKTVNVTVHVSSDEDEVAAERQARAAQNTTKTRTRTQSPKGHNVTFDTTTSTADNQRRANVPSGSTAGKPIIKQQNSQRFDENANSNAGVGLGSNARILPIEVDLTNNMDYDEYNTEMRRNDANSTFNRDVNVNRGLNFGNDRLYNSAPMHQVTQTNTGYRAPSTNLGYSQTSTVNNNYQQDVRDIPFTGYSSPTTNLGYSQTRNTTYQQNEHTATRQGFITSPPENTINRSLGFYSPGSPPDAFNKENKASHSSTLGSQYGVATSPSKQDSFFKRPQALSKSNVTSTSYNEDDAQRLYPRLPTDLPSPPSYSTSSSESAQSTRSQREPSLTKSGVMTTSYYQEISPVKEVKHYEVESGDEPAIVDGAGDYNRGNTAGSGTLYERSSYLAGIQRGTEAHSPFESHLKSSSLRDTLDSSPRYSSSPLARESFTATAAPKPSSPLLNQRYSTTTTSRGGNTSYTRSIDEPDSGSDTEKLSGDEIYVQDSEEDEYVPEHRKIYSSFGSNKIQERVPYRRSNTTRLSASPSSGRYTQSALTRQHLHDDDDEDDIDINTSLRNFVTTLDRKYHIKQMLYMFAIFAAAVFVYVLFIERPPNEDDLLVAAKAAHI